MNTKLSGNPEVKGLISDCDGTLIDSVPLHMQAARKAGMVTTDIRLFI